VLNDPRKPSRPIDPSSSRYPAISTSHTELPKVPPGAFAAYLQSVKPAYASLQRNKRLGHAGRARLTADGAEAADGTEGDESGRASLEEARNIATGARKLPPLSSVPQIFFSEDFNLGNPYTFDLVTERYKSVADHGPGEMRGGEADDGGVYDVALNQMLQEKLSYYSDVVEQHLILEISARSTSFFAALGNLQDLSSEAAACLTRVEALKAELQEQDEQEAKAGLRIVREQARRREIAEQSAAVEAVRQLLEQRDLARLLAQGGEWDEALEVVTALRDVLEGRRSLGGAEDGSTAGLPLGINIEFSAVPALAAILPQLSELEEMVGAQLEAELLNVLEADLGRRIGRPEDVADAMPLSASIVDLREVVQAEAVADGGSAPHTNGTASPPPPVDSMPPEDRTLLNRVEPLLAGLVRTGKVDALPAAYRNVVLRAVRQTLRSHITAEQSEEELENLAALLEDDDAASGRSDARAVPGGFAAAGKLRELEHERFLRLADTLFDGFLRALQAVDVHSRIVVRALTEAAKKADSSLSDNDEVHMPLGVSSGLPLQLSSLVHDATSLSHVLASRLLSLRASTHVKLSLPAFLALFHLTWTFVLRSETLAARMVVGLRGAILNQAKSWLVQFHRERIEGAAKRVEEETWGQAEVTPFDQREVNLIVDSATGDPAAFLLPARAGDEDAAPADAENFKTLEIEEKSYFVVGASTHVLRLLAEYLRVVINLPLLTTEAMGRVVEFLKVSLALCLSLQSRAHPLAGSNSTRAHVKSYSAPAQCALPVSRTSPPSTWR
jgi:vacuolar protein sorting-associated protein 54